MDDRFKASWDRALGHVRDALDHRIDPDLGKDAARHQAGELRRSLAGEAQLLSGHAPGVLAALFSRIERP